MPEDLPTRVRRIIAEQLGIDASSIDADARFIEDLHVDSLDTVELIMAIEDEFERTIPDDHAEKMLTIRDVIAYLLRRGDEGSAGVPARLPPKPDPPSAREALEE